MSNFNPLLDPPGGPTPPAPVYPPAPVHPPAPTIAPAPAQFGAPPVQTALPLGNGLPPHAALPVAHQPGKEKKKPVGILAGILAALAKFGALFVTFFLKFMVFFKTGGTMLISMAAYAWAFRSWGLGIGFVVTIFIHEMGHVAAAKWKKLPVSAPMFIPFMGALIMLKTMPDDALTESEVGYGGPLFGALAATVCWGLFSVTGNPLYAVLAYLTAFMNLFNLMPVAPLDGGRIVSAISPYVWLAGLVGMAAWFCVSHSIIMLLALIFGGKRLYQDWHLIGTSAYYRVSPAARLTMGALYVGLILYLGWMSSVLHTAMHQIAVG